MIFFLCYFQVHRSGLRPIRRTLLVIVNRLLRSDQCDLLICAGRVAIKMMPVLQRIYMQMAEPKWVISMGACASTGGVFDTYAVVQGIDQFLPVDVYVPGCPPRPETLLEGVMAIQRMIEKEGVKGGAERKRGLGLTVAPAIQIEIGSATKN